MINLVTTYQEKDSVFECGFHSFLGQNRTQFSISFFIFALLFLLFDLEILLIYPYVVSAYTNGIYGLVIMLVFFLALTLGFAFELGKNALKIDSRQNNVLVNKNLDQVGYVGNGTSKKSNIESTSSPFLS
jgi:NADH-ubiquinone oxidoreductase chain 3